MATELLLLLLLLYAPLLSQQSQFSNILYYRYALALDLLVSSTPAHHCTIFLRHLRYRYRVRLMRRKRAIREAN